MSLSEAVLKMHKRCMRKITHSIFTKLILVMAGVFVLINIAVFGFLGSALHRLDKSPFHHDLTQYAKHLAREIGIPPDRGRAGAIAKESLFHIIYKGPDSAWSTSEEQFPLHRMDFRPIGEDPDIKIGKFRRHHAFMLEHGPGRIIFISSFTFAHERIGGGHFVILVLMLTGIVVLTWLVLSRILRPLKWLSTGVEQVSGGNLEHRLPESRRDEFGDLSSAFNTMTERISHMLTNRERLLLDVSHELRSPLTRMNVAMEFLPEGKARDTIKADVREMEQMIMEILETERLRNSGKDVKMQEVNMTELVHETADIFSGQAPGIKTVRIDKDLRCMADRELTVIVIKNLFTNALKYSQEDVKPVEVSAFRETDRIVITIKDYGEGIPAEDLPHIFEPFYRVDKSRSRRTGGYGLGLSLCKTIMDAQGGKIEVRSTHGKGTEAKLSFSFTSPL